MSWYTPEQKRESIAKARTLLAETAPAAQREATALRRSGPELVFKIRDNGRPVERTPPAHSAPAKSAASQLPWQDWVEERIEDRAKMLVEATGRGMAEWVGRKLDPLERELALLRREFSVLREEVGLERELRDLRRQVVEAQKAIPKLPEIEAELEVKQARLDAEQTRLRRELDATKDKLGKLRVDQSITNYGLRELEKQTTAATKASIEMETSSARVVLRNIHPDAAKALREFASGVIDAQDGGAVWGRIQEARH
jgi:hypothetical protein